MDEFVISEVARLTGYSPAMIRYFEKSGVITPSTRTPAGYRLFGRRHIEELRFVREMRNLGLPVKVIRALREIRSTELPPSERRAAIAEVFQEHASRIEKKIQLLLGFQARLRAAAPDFVDRVLEGDCAMLTAGVATGFFTFNAFCVFLACFSPNLL